MELRIRRQRTMRRPTETAKMNTRSITFRSFQIQQPRGNEFPWLRHIVMTDNNGTDIKIIMYIFVKCVHFFLRATGFGMRATKNLKLVSQLGTPKYERICRTLDLCDRTPPPTLKD